MAYIYYNKETNKYRLFGSLPVMCKEKNLNYKSMQYYFRDGEEYENEEVKIIKQSLKRGGKLK